jgi:hypothetical protein
MGEHQIAMAAGKNCKYRMGNADIADADDCRVGVTSAWLSDWILQKSKAFAGTVPSAGLKLPYFDTW